MQENLLEIDLAMNMIKEDIIKDLSDSVIKQNPNSFYKDLPPSKLSFSDSQKD